MLLGLQRYLAGTLDVVIAGREPEQLINQAVAEGFDLWHLRRRPDAVEARMRAVDFPDLRPLCRRSRCRVRIRRRWGWPFVSRRLRRRRGLLLGAVFCVAVLAWAFSHVWEVDVQGTQLLDPQAVRAGLRELGLRPGALRSRVKPAELEQRLTEVVPEVGWAAVQVQGVRAVVRVVERTVYRAPPQPGRVDLVADRDNCVVDLVVVYQGQRRVQEGEYVQPGKVLIEGGLYGFSSPPMRLPFMKEWPPTPDKPLGPRVARGQVMARCFHSAYLEVPLVEEERIPTGERHRRLVLRWGQRDIILLGGKQPPAGPVEVESTRLGLPGWRNWLPPVELESVVYDEVTIRRRPVPEAQAIQEAVGAYLQQLSRRFRPGSERILGTPQVQIQVRTEGRLGIRVLVETREEIGRPQPAVGSLESHIGGKPDF